MPNFDDYVEWRRHFHQYPEVSKNEYETTKKLKEILTAYDIKVLDLPLETGLIAEVGQGDDFVAVRTDIDALPINEQVDHAFKSTNEGAMHACGHDIHMASILAVATKLKEIEADLKGRVRLLFQPAEEVGFGALSLVDTGALEGVKAVLGYHNFPTLNIGEFMVKSGPVTSSVDRFEFKIKGKGAHAAKPEQGNDTVIVLGQLINSIQSIVSRNIAAFDNAVVTIGEVSSGNTWNVIADEAYVQGTVRSFDQTVRQKIEDRMKQIGDGLAQAFDLEIETLYHRVTAAVSNDTKLTNDAVEVAKEVGYDVSIMDEPLTIGEDFSGYSTHYPSVFAFIGSNSDYDLHHPKFDPDERILETVPDYFVTFVNKLFDES
ncbi:amidohydrolase [Staphylococcus kloosii]|jgi:amidohydrolase|uniref:N-acetyl-L,L-diaminopimelate deacetylase n=1 Tax=Staphylococcus kloosii TaxID=29384 RepID=A0A151A1Y5_9STAP|nr:amidohydrolase [Staphylococcus kloosii]AVQ35435.1 amidohydrolase [Staphylococcus kloosii]KYH13323.1 N-acetyl-L,L-diaminopimelate deacetylase [Staphylococcus kloosii]MBF7021375.1 amidohydrolase [Staphylococcus kloosii]MBF7030652.1 amidohydrolase [Staphylococcus kloosii]MCD8879910.1 amidohydrolase [Staphylococcus kloosii]